MDTIRTLTLEDIHRTEPSHVLVFATDGADWIEIVRVLFFGRRPMDSRRVAGYARVKTPDEGTSAKELDEIGFVKKRLDESQMNVEFLGLVDQEKTKSRTVADTPENVGALIAFIDRGNINAYLKKTSQL
jgi:hypothetical protein